MMTAYWIGVAVFWIAGLALWNKIYPKRKGEDGNA